MAGTRSYVDIGAIQRPESGGPSARTSYVDIGAAQRQEVAGSPVLKGLSAVVMAGALAAWPAFGEPQLQPPNNVRQKIAPLTLPTGSQPPKKPLLTNAELANRVTAWTPTWDAQSRPRSFVPILPTVSQPTPSGPLSVVEVSEYVTAWIATWDAQHAPVGGWITPPPALTYVPPSRPQVYVAPPDPLPVQLKPSAIVANLPTVSQPTPSGPATPTELSQIATAWIQIWDAQSAPKLVQNQPAVSQPIPSGPATPTELTQFAVAGLVTWDAQTYAKNAAVNPPPILALIPKAPPSWHIVAASLPPDPLPVQKPLIAVVATLPTGAQPIPSGPLSVAEISEYVTAWVSTWDAQTQPKNAATNLPPVLTFVPVAPVPWHIVGASNPPDPPPVQRFRSVVPTFPAVSQPIPQAPLSPNELVDLYVRWLQTWDAQRQAPQAAWNIPPIPPAVIPLHLPDHVYRSWEPPPPMPLQLFKSFVPALTPAPPPDPSDIEAAICAVLQADPTLQTLCPDGVWVDEAPPNLQRFVIVHLIQFVDMNALVARSWEDAVYLIEAHMLAEPPGSNTTAIKSAALRIDQILERVVLTVNGFTWMSMVREERTRLTEIDPVDPGLRWNRRGGRYRVQVSL